MRSCVGLAATWRALNKQMAAIQAPDRMNRSGYLIRVVTNSGKTLKAGIVAPQNACDRRIPILSALQHSTDIAGDGRPQDLVSERTLWDERKPARQRLSIPSALQRDLE